MNAGGGGGSGGMPPEFFESSSLEMLFSAFSMRYFVLKSISIKCKVRGQILVLTDRSYVSAHK